MLTSCGSKKAVSSSPNTLRFEHEALSGKTKPDFPAEAENEEFVPGAANALESFVAEWIGTPHQMGGMNKDGVDCSGFVILAYQQVFEEEFKNRRAEDIFYELQPLGKDELQPGDLVFFKIKSNRINHVGLYMGNSNFAHASSSAGVIISSLELAYFKKYFFRGGRKPHLN